MSDDDHDALLVHIVRNQRRAHSIAFWVGASLGLLAGVVLGMRLV